MTVVNSDFVYGSSTCATDVGNTINTIEIIWQLPTSLCQQPVQRMNRVISDSSYEFFFRLKGA